MKPSAIAENFGNGRLPVFMGLSAVGPYVRQRGLYPRDGVMVEARGRDVASLLRLQSLQQIEERINTLAHQMRVARERFESALGETLEIANTSVDPYEIHYMASMFMHQREVLRALAKNPNISERTQFLLVENPLSRKDREIQLSLAHNPSLVAPVMTKMLSYCEDAFVLHGVALNAARQSRLAHGDTPYADICKQLAVVHSDATLARAAIPGVKDPETLRQLADIAGPLLASDKLEAIAENLHTPDDVLERMMKSPFARLEFAFGTDIAGKARHSLAVKRQRAAGVTPDVAP